MNIRISSNLTAEQIKQKFLDLAELTFMDFYAVAPVDTGFLRDHIIVETIVSDGTFMGFSIEVRDVPYMQYTNEEWTTGHNPNLGWFDTAVERIIEKLIEEVTR